MLNKPLYAALRQRFRHVRVTHENEQRVASRNERTRRFDVFTPGEHYQVCCPFCGDTRHRLSISYRWMMSGFAAQAGEGRSLINCYNEGCEQVWQAPFRNEIERLYRSCRAEALFAPEADLRKDEQAFEVAERSRPRRETPLPEGSVILSQLPQDHPSREFLRWKYPGLPEQYLMRYNLMYCHESTKRYRLAARRLIFPIYGADGLVVSWQGRTIDPDVNPRWYNPPGFRRDNLFNVHSVPPDRLPILAEGIPSAIACGPSAIACYSVSPETAVLKLLADKYDSIILALDPDAYVPDNRPGGRGVVKLDKLLARCNNLFRSQVRYLKWPADILEQARAYCDGRTKEKPPDAADLGVKRMWELLRESDIPVT